MHHVISNQNVWYIDMIKLKQGIYTKIAANPANLTGQIVLIFPMPMAEWQTNIDRWTDDDPYP